MLETNRKKMIGKWGSKLGVVGYPSVALAQGEKN